MVKYRCRFPVVLEEIAAGEFSPVEVIVYLWTHVPAKAMTQMVNLIGIAFWPDTIKHGLNTTCNIIVSAREKTFVGLRG
ncbi:MAG: hypothetical protein M1587_11750 [Thaumarchaeota archaeon]|nr:hypothetical protein [Nitrososphaerota archaeon]